MKSNNKKSKKKPFSWSKLIFYFFTIIIFGFAIYYFATIKKDVKLLGKVNFYWLCSAMAAQALTYLLSALIYSGLLKIFESKFSISIWDFFQAGIVALFANQTIPSAGLSGNAFFYSYLIKRGISASQIISLIVIELLTFYVASEIIIVCIGIVDIMVVKMPSFFLLILLGGLLVFGLFAFLVSYMGRSKSSNRLYKKLSSVKFVKKHLDKFLKGSSPSTKMKNPWKLFSSHKPVITKAIIFQILIFLADSFTIFALFNGLGVPISYGAVATALMLTKIVSLLPISPGALILYESSLTYFLVSLHLPFGTSLLVTLLYRLLSFWMPMPIGFFLYERLQKI